MFKEIPSAQKKMLILFCAGGILGTVVGYNINGKAKEEKIYTEEIIENKININYTLNKQEEKEKKEDNNIERVITRTIKVPCNCESKTDLEGKKDNSNINYNNEGNQLSFNTNGFQIISERIEENIKQSKQETEKTNIQVKTEIEKEDKKQEVVQKETIEKKDLDWFIGVGVGYDWGDGVENYSVSASRRIAGPFWLGADLSVNHKLGGSVGAKISIGF